MGSKIFLLTLCLPLASCSPYQFNISQKVVLTDSSIRAGEHTPGEASLTLRQLAVNKSSQIKNLPNVLCLPSESATIKIEGNSVSSGFPENIKVTKITPRNRWGDIRLTEVIDYNDRKTAVDIQIADGHTYVIKHAPQTYVFIGVSRVDATGHRLKKDSKKKTKPKIEGIASRPIE